MSDLPKRKRIRLKNYDYSQNNYYYVTICTENKKHLFGMADSLTAFGKIADKNLNTISDVFPFVRIDRYIIMPNHIHAILIIENEQSMAVNSSAQSCSKPTLGTVIGNYKSAVTREIHCLSPGIKVWQKRYYEHIIRSDEEYENICTYIDDNPEKWESDDYY